jgi:pimeloyl-ACP methyl ester carboxylesterase
MARSCGEPMTAIREMTLATPQVEFRCLTAGSGSPVLLLHGFPDNARTWHHQMDVLARAGHHVVAPFMRGCPPTSPPKDGRYDVVALAGDVANLIEAIGSGPAAVIGHDFGAVATFAAAALHPEMLRSAAVLAVAHPAMFVKIFSRPDLLRYGFDYWLLQLPGVGEHALSSNEMSLIDDLWRAWSPMHDHSAHVRMVKAETYEAAGAVDAVVGYYRDILGGALGVPGSDKVYGAISVPTLSIWGANDPHLVLATGEDEMFDRGYRRDVLPDAGHFVHLDAPHATAALLVAWMEALDHGPAPK